jgi:membrane protease YdiL (CAAX protease family)
VSNRNLILLLAFFTLVGFPAIGYLIQFFFGDADLQNILTGKINILFQILIGFPFGWITAEIAKWIIQRNFMKPVIAKYGNIISELNLKPWHAVYISICAGVGEELLFRGALQPMWGICITSLVFVALHGYLNPWDWRISLYGTYLTLVIICLGYMTEHYGIWMAAAAHTAIDIVLLLFLCKNQLTDNEV